MGLRYFYVTTQYKKDCHRGTETQRDFKRVYFVIYIFLVIQLGYYSFAIWKLNPNISLALSFIQRIGIKIAQFQNPLCLSASVANHTE